MNSYLDFAGFYDELTGNIAYDKIGDFLLEKLSQHQIQTGILLDLACGTGSLCEYFAHLKYEVIGVDASAEMLAQAMEKKLDSGSDIIYLCQKMQELDLYGTVDVAICTLDSLNHLESESALQETLNRVSLFLDPSGIFIFDMNTVYKHKEILADNTYVYDCENVYCVWQNTFLEDNKVRIHLDLFEREEECYFRSEEEFYEIAYPVEKIEQMLAAAGLEIINCYDDYTEKVPDDKTQRIVYVTKKR